MYTNWNGRGGKEIKWFAFSIEQYGNAANEKATWFKLNCPRKKKIASLYQKNKQLTFKNAKFFKMLFV